MIPSGKWSQLTEWEKIFANTKSDKRLAFRIYKELLHIHNKKANNPTIKWTRGLNRYSSKEDTRMAETHMKRSTMLLVIKDENTNQQTDSRSRKLEHRSNDGRNQKLHTKNYFPQKCPAQLISFKNISNIKKLIFPMPFFNFLSQR